MKTWKQGFIGVLAIAIVAVIGFSMTACDDGSVGSGDDNGGGAYTPGTYLITTRWGQEAPYNNNLPINLATGKRFVTDCARTAVAQIIAYHKYPASTTITIPAGTFMHAGQGEMTVPATPPVAFDWNNMADGYKKADNPTEAQNKAVADLMFTVIKSSWLGGSNYLITYFGYDYRMRTVYRKDFASDLEWENLIKDQIDQGLPVFCWGRTNESGDEDGNANHAFVIDGYDDAGKFHINWGFNGNHDGFYRVSDDGDGLSLNPPNYPKGFRHSQQIYINFRPGIDPINRMIQSALKGGTYKLEANDEWDTASTYEITVMNDFTLDLNGYTLTINKSSGNGIKIAPGKTFTIKDSRSGGVLNVSGGSNRAGINTTEGTLVIESGTVNATGGSYGAGIGGGRDGSGGIIVINGGMVNATGGSYAAGIGGGRDGIGGGTITINGGTVNATGTRDGAGIGGGYHGNGGIIAITGGTVRAIGGSAEDYSNSGAGIGGGMNSSGGTITISGGTVEAIGGKCGAGIGGGYGGSGGTITITNGTINATTGGQYAAGIGGGYQGNGGTITITGGTVTAVGGTRAENIGKGYNGESSGEIVIGGGAVIR